MFAVLNQVFVGAEIGYMGDIISKHRTEENAFKAMAKVQRGTKKYHGDNSYLPMIVVSLSDYNVDGRHVSKK